MEYYIFGNPDNALLIKASFKALGYNVNNFHFTNGSNVIYFTFKGSIDTAMKDSITGKLVMILAVKGEYKELQLLSDTKSKFKVGTTVERGSCRTKIVGIVNSSSYVCDGDIMISFAEQDLWKEVSPELKFKVGNWVVGKDGKPFTSGNYAEQITTIDDEQIWLSSKTWVDNDYIRLWTIADARDGDVLATTDCPFIYRKTGYNNDLAYYYAGIDGNGNFCEGCLKRTLYHFGSVANVVPATKEQRILLFKKMKEAGYTWDEKKKELKKIVEPKFKVGDDIKTGSTIETIAEIGYATRSYYCESGRTIYFENQDLWHLAHKMHYDIANFKPKQWVLVRDDDEWEWALTRFSHLSNGSASLFVCINGASFQQCIPLEDNETLLGTTDPCPEEYINW